jgi:hypothetical protein
MKSIRRKIATAVGTAAFAGIMALTAFSQNARETNIKALDSVGINGGSIDYTYTVSSKCPARSHDSSVEVTAKTTQKVVNAFSITIYDTTYESRCNARIGDVTVSGSADLAQEIADKSDEMRRKGYRISPSATFVLPPISIEPFGNAGTVSDTQPPPYHGPRQTTGPRNPTEPVMVDVTEISYKPAWHCKLFKNDGARNDGFDGNGATIEEARRAASQGCRSTNNPYCDAYSKSPGHTTCDVQLQETTKVNRYDSNNPPPNAVRDTWACTLNRNDGAGGDGFTGIGRTEEDARSDAANKCSPTNRSQCGSYSTDNRHTSCAQRMVLYGPKPQAAWKCTMYKNDGSRNDGFAGAGSTETEARSNTIPGCQSTNNPYCQQYSTDPVHTQCTVDFAYPQ